MGEERKFSAIALRCDKIRCYIRIGANWEKVQPVIIRTAFVTLPAHGWGLEDPFRLSGATCAWVMGGRLRARGFRFRPEDATHAWAGIGRCISYPQDAIHAWVRSGRQVTINPNTKQRRAKWQKETRQQEQGLFRGW